MRILDFHDHVTATFDDVDDAIQFHDGMVGREVKYAKRDGTDGQVEPLRPRPPHIKRRGTALHPVYEVLDREVVTSEEKIKQVHRTRGSTPYTMYYAMNRATEHIRLMATASWIDSGTRVTLKEIVAEPNIPDDAKTALRELVGAPTP